MKNALFALLVFLTAAPAHAESMRARAHMEGQYVSVEDVKAEIEFGREVAARVIGKYGLYKNGELTRYINLVGKSIARYSNRPELDFTFGVLDTGVINAFAAPGGYVFVTKGALEAMTNEAQLAAVLAHEIIHVSEKHIVKELNIKGSEESAVAGLGRLIGGATDVAKVAFVQAVDQAVAILFQRGYKQADELEADTLGVTLASSMGYSAGEYVDFLQLLKRKSGDFRTDNLEKLHPPFSQRVKWVKNAIEDFGLGSAGGKVMAARYKAGVGGKL